MVLIKMTNENKPPIIQIVKSGGCRGYYYFDVRYSYIQGTSSYMRTIIKKEYMKRIISNIIQIIKKGLGGRYEAYGGSVFNFHKDGSCEVIVSGTYYDLSEWATSEEILRIMKVARRLVNNTQ